MPLSGLLFLLLVAAAARLLASPGRVIHAQDALFPVPASTNVSTSSTPVTWMTCPRVSSSSSPSEFRRREASPSRASSALFYFVPPSEIGLQSLRGKENERHRGIYDICSSGLCAWLMWRACVDVQMG
ncbi:unnamed protein product [Urochloa humidicola]